MTTADFRLVLVHLFGPALHVISIAWSVAWCLATFCPCSFYVRSPAPVQRATMWLLGKLLGVARRMWWVARMVLGLYVITMGLVPLAIMVATFTVPSWYALVEWATRDLESRSLADFAQLVINKARSV